MPALPSKAPAHGLSSVRRKGGSRPVGTSKLLSKPKTPPGHPKPASQQPQHALRAAPSAVLRSAKESATALAREERGPKDLRRHQLQARKLTSLHQRAPASAIPRAKPCPLASAQLWRVTKCSGRPAPGPGRPQASSLRPAVRPGPCKP